ncbi:tRNA intron endonuclease [Circinella umbellata]|nr:tRNA intron endonuclease [Circinella umbellata]
MVKIKLCGDKPLIFNTQDVKELRCQHHIVGSLIGTLSILPLQNSFLGLPLQLLPEECTLLLKKKIGIMDDIQSWTYPNTNIEKLRYQVFEYLWSQKLYITTGLKFGGDYLVYLGDPMRFHSHYIITAKDRNESMTGLDIVNMGRLATNVKKTFVLISPNDDENHIFSIEWAGF